MIKKIVHQRLKSTKTHLMEVYFFIDKNERVCVFIVPFEKNTNLVMFKFADGKIDIIMCPCKLYLDYLSRIWHNFLEFWILNALQLCTCLALSIFRFERH